MSASARNHRSINHALPAVISLFFILSLILPGIVRGQPITEGFDGFVAPDWNKPTGWIFSGIADGDNYTTAGDYGAASPSIKLDTDGYYIRTAPLFRPDELSFWAKGMGTDVSSYLLVEEYYLDKGTGWTEVTKVMPLPAGGTNFLALPLEFLTTDLRFTYFKSAGDLAFDDVGITLADPTPSVTPTPTTTPSTSPTPVPTATPTPPKDIPNPGFEEEPPLVGWTKVANKENYVARSTDQAYEGTYSCTFSDTGYVTDKYTDQGIRSGYVYSIIPGDEYDVSGWFFVGDKAGEITDNLFQFNIEWLSGSMVVSTDSYTDWSLQSFNTWEKKEYRLTAPSTADRARVYIAAREITNNNNLVYIDEFHLIHTPIFFVDSPAEGDAWYVGETYTISWEAPHVTTNIDIHYSTDGGSNWTPVALNISDTGTYDWPVPPAPSNTARVRIRDAGGAGASGQSDLFRIVGANTINITSPIGGEVWYYTATYDIEWTRGPATIANPVDLHYSVDNGGSWTEITSGIPIDPGSYAWTIPNEDSSQCLVRIRQSGTGLQGVSPQVFSIMSPTFTVTYPRGGEYLYYGESETITWTYTAGVTGNVDIDYSLTGPTGPWYQITTNQPNTGSYSFWDIPRENASTVRLRISEVGGVSTPGISAADFTLKAPLAPQPYRPLNWGSLSSISTSMTLSALEAIDENNIWVAADCGLMYFWDGNTWEIKVQLGGNIRAMAATSPTDLWAGSLGGGLFHFDGTSWTLEGISGRDMRSISMSDPTRAIASSYNNQVMYMSSYLKTSGWSHQWFGGSAARNAVLLTPSLAYVAVSSGGVGIIYELQDANAEWTNLTWALMPGGVHYCGLNTNPFTGVWAEDGRPRLWIAGDCGQISYYDGISWDIQTTVTYLDGFAKFESIAALDENNVWASGNSRIYRYNGSEWFIEKTGISTLYYISILNSGLVYGRGSSSNKNLFVGRADSTPTPRWVTPVDFKTPSPTPVPVPGPIQGRVYDRITGAGVGNVYVRVYPAGSGLRPAGAMTDASGNYYINGIGTPLEAGIYQVFAQGSQGSGIHTYRDQWYNQKDRQTQANLVSSNSAGIDFPLYRTGVYPTPQPTATPFFSAVRVQSGDYSGDGVSDIAIFRPASGLWAVRGVTRAYFGQAADIPVSGDYSGDGKADIAIFRSASGLWAIRGITRSYFGSAADVPVPGDYDGDGSADIGVFRSATGLWAVSGLGRSYFGRAGDVPVSGDYTGDGFMDIAIFRPASGLWAVKDVTRVYFGGFGDTPVPGDYDGLGMIGPALFRSSSGLWAVRDVTRAYFGNSAYQAVPGSFAFPGLDEIGVFRPSSGLWAIQGLTRAYFGGSEDLPATR